MYMQVLAYKVLQQKYLIGGFTLSNILLIVLISVSILLIFLAIAILIRLNRLNNKLKQMGINYDITGFGVKEEKDPFKNMHNNYQNDKTIINNNLNQKLNETHYIKNDYNNGNNKIHNITNVQTKENNNFKNIYTKDEFDNNEESNIDLGVFTKINYSNYNTNTNSINPTNNNNTYDDNITVSSAIDTNVNKIIIKPKGSN